MELYQLRSFAAVAALEHLTRAAERLHVSQPALSAQIRALEDELGVPLFERRPSGMALTPAGRALLPRAEAVIAAAQALRNEARQLKGEVNGSLHVGILSDPEVIRLPELLALAVERHPLLELQLSHEVSGEAFERVRDGQLDASFYYGDRTDPGVASIALREIVYRVAAPASWRERLERAGASPLVDEPWIMAPPISTHYQLAQSLFAELGWQPAKVVEADDEAVIASLVAAGLGMALVREDVAVARARAGEVVPWRNVRLRTNLQFIYPADRERDPSIHALRDMVSDIWAIGAPAAARKSRRALRERKGVAGSPAAGTV